jgi:hypothetical protein
MDEAENILEFHNLDELRGATFLNFEFTLYCPIAKGVNC